MTMDQEQSPCEHAQERRRKVKAKRSRPMQDGVPDRCSPEFGSDARRQSAHVSADPAESADQAFIDAASAGVWDDE